MNDLVLIDEHKDDDPSIDDEEGRAALVQTILKLSSKVRKRHDVRLFLGEGTDPLDHPASLNGHPLWLLAEFLCVLIVLDEAQSVGTRQVYRLRGRVPQPVPFVRDTQRRFLWIQHPMHGRQSGFLWRPDLVITENGQPPSAENVLEIVECKHRRKLDSATIRSEFAKGFDLEAPAYLIWSYFEVSQRVCDGADRLGLRLRTIGLAGPDRARLRDPDELASRISAGMRETREATPLAAALIRGASAAADKADRERRLR
jgi:hypothetical protein